MSRQDDPRPERPRLSVFLCDRTVSQSYTWPSSPLQATEPADIRYQLRCAHTITPADLKREFADGADGVLIYGCLRCDGQQATDNLTELRFIHQHTQTLRQLGIAADRLRLEWGGGLGETPLRAAIADFANYLLKTKSIAPGLRRAASTG